MRDEVYYNLWNEKLAPKQKELMNSVCVPVTERKYIDQAYNDEAFSKSFSEILRELQTSAIAGANYRRYLDSRTKWLQNLHSDYLGRLLGKDILPEQVILDSFGSWVAHTRELLSSAMSGSNKFSPFNVPQSIKTSNPQGYARWLDAFPVVKEAFLSTLDQIETYQQQVLGSGVESGKDRHEQQKPSGNAAVATFSDRIKYKEKVGAIMSILHKNMDGKRGVKACIFIQAAIEAGVFYDKPTYVLVSAEFPAIGSRANYDKYTGSRSYIHKRWFPTIDRVVGEFKSILPAEN